MNVFFSDEQDEPADGEALHRLAVSVLQQEGLPEGTEMSLVLVDAEQMAGYNEQFLDRPGPTDVLALPLQHLAPGHPPRRVANEPPIALGDVFVCPDYVARRAAAEALDPLDYDIRRLVVHGILHLLGYDHHDDRDADLMERREDELLESGEAA
ncbi:MAG: rRNA maturation RNase YbeY [Actinobacteria bacterium]|nr:rRNA maturation RNase YbeY [Actinomycetota bacterium]